MVIGALRVTLLIPEARCLKDRRRVVRSLLDRLMHRFNAAVAETGELSSWTRAELAVVTVSNDARHVNSMLDKIRDFIEQHAEAEVASAEMEFI